MKFRAHIAEDGREQSVFEHCKRTAEIAKASLEGVSLGETGYLAGLMHDMGKMTPKFDDYIEKAARGDPVKKGSVIHTFSGVKYILDKYHDSDDPYNKISSEIIAYAIGAHHGLFDCIDEYHNNGYQHRIEWNEPEYDESRENFLKSFFSDPDNEIDKLFYMCRDEIKNLISLINERILSKRNKDKAEKSVISRELDFYLGQIVRLILSAVINGDRKDTAEFMADHNSGTFIADKIFWSKYVENVEKKIADFENKCMVDEARSTISELCIKSAVNKPGVYRLNSPTGAGKTLSSLRYALLHAKIYEKKRIIFTTPLLSILDQNAQVIRDFVSDDSIILEHHSNIILDKEESEELKRKELLKERWDSPVIITTMVQLLNTIFDGKTASIRRYHALCNSVIVIDEAQTVPSNMITLFNLAINFLTYICDATIVLCSATLPEFSEVDHPIVFSEKPDIITYDKVIWEPFIRTEIVDSGAKSLEEIVELSKEMLEKNNSLLIVCNKKSEAAGIFDRVKDNCVNAYHLSTSMCMKHRRDTLDDIRKSLGSGEKTICVSTQLIEAGVDISFGSVIRLSAGLDSIIQSAGRCNRNGENGGLSPVYIVQLIDEDLSKLKDIQMCQNATNSLLAQYKTDKRRFNERLDSVESVKYYYRILYKEMSSGFQDYRCEKEYPSVFSLLSDNQVYKQSESGFVLNQAFKLAGNLFKVFDDDTVDVIVPYLDGKDHIADLCSERSQHDYDFFSDVVDKVKQYSVSLYSYQLDILKKSGGVFYVGDETIIALKEEHYDRELGVVLDSKTDLFLEV